LARDLLKQAVAQCRQEMVRHSRLSCHTGGLLPFAADSRQEDLLQVDPECINGCLRLTGTLVERFENHRQPSFGFALGHVYETAEKSAWPNWNGAFFGY